MLKGKIAIVTGSSGDIGRALVLKLAENHAHVAALFGGNREAAEDICRQAEAFGVRALPYQCDVADPAQTKAIVEAVLKDMGGADILINNAGITRDNLMPAMTDEDYDLVLDTNLKGAFNMIRSLYRHFMRQKSGKIINMSSISGLLGNPGQVNYSASKAGLIGLTKSVARELGSRGICCNAIAPGFMDTAMARKVSNLEELVKTIPLRRLGAVEEAAELAVFLASDKANYITGEVIRVDGGMAM